MKQLGITATLHCGSLQKSDKSNNSIIDKLETTDTVSEFHAEAPHRQLRAKDLPDVPT